MQEATKYTTDLFSHLYPPATPRPQARLPPRFLHLFRLPALQRHAAQRRSIRRKKHPAAHGEGRGCCRKVSSWPPHSSPRIPSPVRCLRSSHPSHACIRNPLGIIRRLTVPRLTHPLPAASTLSFSHACLRPPPSPLRYNTLSDGSAAERAQLSRVPHLWLHFPRMPPHTRRCNIHAARRVQFPLSILSHPRVGIIR